jgi:hypothetical protein
MSDAALVQARLGRPPQDMLEAAVVLEAWAGVPAQRALEAGGALMPAAGTTPLASAAVLAPAERRPELVVEGFAFVASVVAIAFWAGPLAAALGPAAVTRALTLALPLTLALQWALRSRYLSRPHGLAELAGVRVRLACGAVAVVACTWLALGRAGAVAGLLTVMWTGGGIVMRRGWAALYAAIVLGATAPMTLGVAPLPVLAGTALLVAAAVAAAVRGEARRTRPGRRGRAATCALLGFGLGVMLVADPGVGWGDGAAPALALLPSAIAGVWAGLHLGRLGHAIPRALAGIPAAASARPPAASSRLVPASEAAPLGPLGVLLGAIVRLLGGAAAGSFGLALVVPVGASVLVAFALLALATLVVSLLETIGRIGWAALGVACAVAAELAGGGLAGGAAVGAVVLLPAAVAPLLHPARTLATTLWIP